MICRFPGFWQRATSPSPVLPDIWRLIPPPVHIAALRLAHGLRTRWWRLRRGRVIGCQVVAFDHAERVMLIRHSYGTRAWTLPCGGMKRGEDALTAALREAFEEAGVRLERAVQVGVHADNRRGWINDVRVIAGWTADLPMPDGREIIAAQFFALDALPQDLARSLPELLPQYLRTAKAARR